MNKINEKIKEMRLKRGLTLLEVAEYLGVKEATVQRYESGSIKNIKYEIICKLADLFCCDPCYLMGWSSDINIEQRKSPITSSNVVQGNNAPTLIVNNDNISKHKISNQAAELLRIFEKLNIKSQTELLSFAFELEDKTTKNDD